MPVRIRLLKTWFIQNWADWYDEKYFKDGTNDHPVDAFRYQAVIQFYREAAK